MACYKARGFLQKAESLGLTALGFGRRQCSVRASRRCEAVAVRTGLVEDGRVSFFAPPPSGQVAKHRTARTGTQKGSKGFGQDRQLRLSPDNHGCEGIVSKRLGLPYRSGRSPHWLKIKNPRAPAVTREAEEDW
jgi:hypothetical protein